MFITWLSTASTTVNFMEFYCQHYNVWPHSCFIRIVRLFLSFHRHLSDLWCLCYHLRWREDLAGCVSAVERCVIVANVWRAAEISRSHTWRPVDWCMKLLWPTQRTRRQALSASFTNLLPCLLDLSGALSITNDWTSLLFLLVCVWESVFLFIFHWTRLTPFIHLFISN